MRREKLALVTVIFSIMLHVGTAHGQAANGTRGGKRTLLKRDAEIALARSAAPADVSRDATVYVLTDSGYAVAITGTNGNACFVDRSWPEAIEPQCFDSEGAATVMAIALHRISRVQQGVQAAAVDREIADGLVSGKFRLPKRPSMSYMMSAAQQLVSDDGRPVGKWQPHLMLYVPYVTGKELGLGEGQDMAAAMVTDAGKPFANITIVVSKFVEVAGINSPKP